MDSLPSTSMVHKQKLRSVGQTRPATSRQVSRKLRKIEQRSVKYENYGTSIIA